MPPALAVAMGGPMELARPRFATRDDVFAARPARAAAVRVAGLWVAGCLAGLERPTVAVVGSRAPSESGAARARALGTALATAGACVISGLALGIDGAAHAGALAGGGTSIGVLGGGHRRFFPRRNRELAERLVAAGGAVLSPFAPDEPARPPQFLQRNGIVAALADVVVIVEAAARSGALNTATWAADLGIDVLAYPGDVDRPLAAGCNALIRDGATLVRGPADVLDALGLRAATAAGTSIADDRRAGDRFGGDRRGGIDVAAAKPGAGGIADAHAGEAGEASVRSVCDDPAARTVLAAVAREPRDLDALAERTGIAPGALMSLVVRLELEGRLSRADGLVRAVRA